MPWVSGSQSPCGLKGRESLSIPYVTLIKLYLRDFEESAKFLLKGFGSVVLALVANIASDVFDVRLAYRERSVLPARRTSRTEGPGCEASRSSSS